MKDEGRWHVGNAFVSRGQAEPARKPITEILLPVHQEHTSLYMAQPLMRTV
jgi:hypothetical protein